MNTVTLIIISGTPKVGTSIVATFCNCAGWSNTSRNVVGYTMSFTYQWNRSGAPIRGATNSTYTPVAADVGKTLTVSVIAINSIGSSSAATSEATVPVIDVSPTIATPAIISGTPQVGAPITATDAVWNHTVTSSAYQWKAGGVNAMGPGSATLTYTPITADIGLTLTLTVTATNTGGASAPSTSAASAVVINAINTMIIMTPFSPTVVNANQVTAPALQYIAISDANAGVPRAPLAVHVLAPGQVNVEVWTHGAFAVRLTGDVAGNFTGNLDLTAEAVGPLLMAVFTWNKPPGDNTYTVHLSARMILQVQGTPAGIGSLPVGASGMPLTWSDEFTSLSATPVKPGTGVWPTGLAPTASDGFTWYENKPGGGDFGDAAFEHTDSVYNPYTIINSFLRIRSTYDPNYVDPYGFGRHWRSGLLATAFPDGTSNLPLLSNGYYESRIMIPTADTSFNIPASGGTWPAFWTLDKDAVTNTSIGNVEWDIGEWYGVDGTIWHANVHSYSPATGPNTAIFSGAPAPGGADLSWDFHRYGLQVTNTTVSAYFDDVLKGTVAKSALPGGLQINVFLMLNLAMGSGWPDNAPPAGYYDMWIDYVRYYANYTLSVLTLSANVFAHGNNPQGSVIGTVQGLTPSSSLALTDSHSGAVQLVSGVIQVGPTPPATAGTFNISLTETLAAAPNSPNVTTLSINELAGGGTLSGSVVLFTTGQAINLTTLGTSDWAAFGYNVNAASIERKSTGGSQISALSQVGAVALLNYNAASGGFASTWTDGSPDASVTGEGYLVYSQSSTSGPGMSFTVPADTTTRTLKIYVGTSVGGSAAFSNGKLTASLSDGAAIPYTDTSVSGGVNNGLATYTIVYKAASAAQTLTIQWLNNTSIGQNVTIFAATLA
jgi:hypothetical protein